MALHPWIFVSLSGIILPSSAYQPVCSYDQLGGTTGKIGDPTDRLTSRTTLRPSERKANLVNIHLQLKRLGEGIERYAARKGYKREWAWRREVANNSIWYTKLPVRQFMRLLGGSVRMGPLLGRDS